MASTPWRRSGSDERFATFSDEPGGFCSKPARPRDQRLQREALGVLEFAKREGNPGGVLQAIDRLHKGIALLATLAATKAGGDTEIRVRWLRDDELESES